MIDETIVIKLITLLFRESETLEGINKEDPQLLKILERLNPPSKDSLIDIDSRSSHLVNLINTIYDLLETDHDISKKDLLQTIRSNCGVQQDIYDCIKDGIKEELTDGERAEQIGSIRRYLNKKVRADKLRDLVSKTYRDITYKHKELAMSNSYMEDFVDKLEALRTIGGNDKAISVELDLADLDGIKTIMKNTKEYHSDKGILQTGWQGLNEMMQNGFRRGEFIMVSALQHNYKTGFNLSIFEDIAKFNKPYMIDKDKKPLILRLTLEDDVESNIEFLYSRITDGIKISELDENVDISKAAAKVKEAMSATGYHVKMMKVDPSNWSYRELFDIIRGYEKEGFEIHVLIVDYLAMIPTTGCITSGPTGTDLRDLYRRVRNFCGIRKITFITPHQLSTEAKLLLRSGINEEDFVKAVANKGYYAGSRQLDQEVDVELYLHKVIKDDKAFLTIQRGKHRTPNIISESKLYTILPFPPRTPIPSDINQKRIDKRDIDSFALEERDLI